MYTVYSGSVVLVHIVYIVQITSFSSTQSTPILVHSHEAKFLHQRSLWDHSRKKNLCVCGLGSIRKPIVCPCIHFFNCKEVMMGCHGVRGGYTLGRSLVKSQI